MSLFDFMYFRKHFDNIEVEFGEILYEKNFKYLQENINFDSKKTEDCDLACECNHQIF